MDETYISWMATPIGAPESAKTANAPDNELGRRCAKRLQHLYGPPTSRDSAAVARFNTLGGAYIGIPFLKYVSSAYSNVAAGNGINFRLLFTLPGEVVGFAALLSHASSFSSSFGLYLGFPGLFAQVQRV